MNTFNDIFVLYPEHTSTDSSSHINYTDPYFDFIYVANLLVHVMKDSDSFMSKVYIAWIV